MSLFYPSATSSKTGLIVGWISVCPGRDASDGPLQLSTEAPVTRSSPPSITPAPNTANTSPHAAPLPFSATVNETIRLFGLSKTALYVLLAEGRIEARKRGKTTLILMDGVRRYVDALPRATFGSTRSR